MEDWFKETHLQATLVERDVRLVGLITVLSREGEDVIRYLHKEGLHTALLQQTDLHASIFVYKYPFVKDILNQIIQLKSLDPLPDLYHSLLGVLLGYKGDHIQEFLDRTSPVKEEVHAST